MAYVPRVTSGVSSCGGQSARRPPKKRTEKVKETSMNQSLIRNAMALLAVVFAALVAATFVAPQVVSVPTWLTLLHGAGALVTGYAAFGERETARI
jgi:hypothetical protein